MLYRGWIAIVLSLSLFGTVAADRAVAEGYYDAGLYGTGLDIDLSIYADASSYGLSSYDSGYGYGGCGGTFSGCGGSGYDFSGLYGSSWGAYDTSYSFGLNVAVDYGSYYGYGYGDLYGYGYGGCGYGGGSCGGGSIGYDLGRGLGYCSGGILPYPQPMPVYPLPIPQPQGCWVCTPGQTQFPPGYPPANPPPMPLPYPQPQLPPPVVGLPVGELPGLPTIPQPGNCSSCPLPQPVTPPWGGCGGVVTCPQPQPVRPQPTLPPPTVPGITPTRIPVPALPGTQPISPQTPGVPGGVQLPGSHGTGTYVPNISIIGTPPDRNRVPRGNRSLP